MKYTDFELRQACNSKDRIVRKASDMFMAREFKVI